MLRKTKIICTLGPATEDEAVLRRLMLGGMNAARFNFSHCTHEDAAKKLEAVTRLREELGLPVATILDTKGPEIRVKTFKNGPIELKAGDTFTLTTREVEGDDKIVSITYKDLPKDLKAGARVLIDDGLVELRAEHVHRDRYRLYRCKRRPGLQPQGHQRSRHQALHALYQRAGPLGHHLRH